MHTVKNMVIQFTFTHIIDKKIVKATILVGYKSADWFHEIFFGVREFTFFPLCNGNSVGYYANLKTLLEEVFSYFYH